jgi:ribosomal 50S subunit-recycling heat shock protein
LRLDQFLKWCRVIPRRSIAKATCDAGHVQINDHVVRAGRELHVDDVVSVLLPRRVLKFRVRSIPARSPGKAEARELIEILEDVKRESDL